MKKPTKQELYNEIAALNLQLERERMERDKEKLKKWNELLPLAYSEARKTLNKVFPNTLQLLHFEHVDEGGYWFTFNLINDERMQTYAVRHYEIER